jgi:tetratricopeptide (TPR) repeat protein
MPGKKERRDRKGKDKTAPFEASRSLTSLSVPAGIILPTDPVSTLNASLKNASKADSLLPKAYALYGKGEYEEAIKLCDLVYDIDAFRTDNLLLMSSIQFQLRNFSEAVFYAQQCIRVDPNFSEAYSNLGNALKELGDLRAAVQFYNKAIKLKPRFADAYNNLATAHMQLGQLDEAKETYRMALVLDPKLVDAHNNLGKLTDYYYYYFYY